MAESSPQQSVLEKSGMLQPQLEKTSIATRSYVLQIIMSRKNFMDTPSIIYCHGRDIFVIVECRRPHCCSCGTAGHLLKAYPGKKRAPKPTNLEALATSKPASPKRAAQAEKSG